MRKPMIGLVALYDEDKESYWMLPGYMNGLLEAGAVPVMMPLTEEEDTIRQLVGELDGILLTGGHDVDPGVYGEEPGASCGRPCRERDAMERILLEQAIKAGKPVLGICRGIQFLNAHLGGTLYQDLPTQKPSGVEHHMEPPYDVPVHEVRIEKNTPLYEILETEILAVNSYHHQAIKTLAPSLTAMAYAPDGLVEAAYMREQPFVMAVQWHPEFSYKVDENSRRLLTAFVAACR